MRSVSRGLAVHTARLGRQGAVVTVQNYRNRQGSGVAAHCSSEALKSLRVISTAAIANPEP